MQPLLFSFSTLATGSMLHPDESLLLTGLLGVVWIAAGAIAYMAVFDGVDSGR